MERENFGSRFGAIMVIAGSAVGLGNVWRFPGMVGANGGAAFIFIYIFFVVLMCLPIMLSELVIGRKGNSTPSEAMYNIRAGSWHKGRSGWKIVGLLYVLIPALVLTYYCVIGGWTMAYIFKPSTEFSELVVNPVQPVVYTILFLAVTAAIVSSGVRNGLEKASKVMMPLLFLLVIVMAVRSLTLPGAKAGIEFLFKPDFSKVTSRTCLAALGQAFFSLSLGSGVFMAYGSYIHKGMSLTRTAFLTAFFDLLFAICAGLAVMPAVFSFGMDVTEGSGLVFDTLPKIFNVMPLGRIIQVFFFIALFLAALTSSLSQFEVPVSYLVEGKGLSRKTSTIIVLSAATVIGIICTLSLGVLSGWTIFGKTVFDSLDGLCANYLMPLGGVIVVLFVGWWMKEPEVKAELDEGAKHPLPKWFFESFMFIVKYVAPIAILMIFLFDLLG